MQSSCFPPTSIKVERINYTAVIQEGIVQIQLSYLGLYHQLIPLRLPFLRVFYLPTLSCLPGPYPCQAQWSAVAPAAQRYFF